jgi:hypothetical protein
MRFIKTDDPIKGIGFVTINFAYLEDELDEIINWSGHMFDLPDKIDRWKFRDKAEWLQKQFRSAFASYSYPDSNRDRLSADDVLSACRQAALKRNCIVHRPIFGDRKGSARQKIASGKMRRLDITTIDRFAEHVDELHGAVMELRLPLRKLWHARQREQSNESS